MKKIFLNLITGIILIGALVGLTGCNSREDVDYMSSDKMISHVKSNIYEDIEFVQKYTGYHGENVYEFKLTERDDLVFKVEESISNHGLNLDGAQFFDDYQRNVDFGDYMDNIFEINEDKKNEILKKYGLDKYQTKNSKSIYVNNYADFMNLSYCITELDSLYKFNINDEKVNSIDESIGISVKSTDIYISLFSWSLNDKDRITVGDFYDELKKLYISSLKMDGKVDPTIPVDVYNKY